LLREISKILSVRITRYKVSRTIYLDQELYLNKVCNQIGITLAKHKARSTLTANLNSLLVGRLSKRPIDPKQYVVSIGKLMYRMIFTRLDIAFILGRLS
jgi:hypothetical protein